jgi:hypothetical protein
MTSAHLRKQCIGACASERMTMCLRKQCIGACAAVTWSEKVTVTFSCGLLSLVASWCCPLLLRLHKTTRASAAVARAASQVTKRLHAYTRWLHVCAPSRSARSRHTHDCPMTMHFVGTADVRRATASGESARPATACGGKATCRKAHAKLPRFQHSFTIERSGMISALERSGMISALERSGMISALERSGMISAHTAY